MTGSLTMRALACCGLLLAAAAQDAEVQQVTLLEVQGEDAADSPLEGRTVRISALVSAVSGSGFYVQDDSGYGLYVYESTFRPAVGDTVVLVGSISEYHGLTELSHLDSAQSRVVTSGGAAPAPLAVTTGQVGERHEGLLISVEGVCTQADIGHGEWTIDDGCEPSPALPSAAPLPA